MSDQKTNFLYKVAKNEYLKDNTLSLILAKNPNIDISNQENFFDQVKKFYDDYNTEDRNFHLEILNRNDTTENSKWEKKDFRISKILVNNLRTFPKSDLPFEIDFEEDNEISSYVIIGNNGTGKSSLFNAIEYCYTKRIGEAELRTHLNLEDEDIYFKKYLQHYNNPFSECEFNIYTKEGDVFNPHRDNIPLNIRRSLNPNNHFISEFDIHKNCKLDFESSTLNSFSQLIAQNVGLSELLEIDHNIFKFIKYDRNIELNNVKKAENGLNQLNEKIRSYSELLDKNKQILKKSKFEISKEMEKSTYYSLDLVDKLKKIEYSIEYNYEDLRHDIIRFKEQSQDIKNISSRFANKSKVDFLRIGLELLEESHDCPFCMNSKLSKDDIERTARKTVSEYQFYLKLRSELENVSNRIIESLIFLANKLYKLKFQLENEIKEVSNYLISHDYDEITSSLRRTINDIILTDIISLVYENKDIQRSRVNNFVELLLGQEKSFMDKLMYFIKDIRILDQKRKNAIFEFNEKIKNDKMITDSFLQERRLKNEISNLENQINILRNELNHDIETYDKALAEHEFYKKVKEEGEVLYRIVHGEVNKELIEIFEPLKEIIINVLNDYLNESRNNEIELIIENEADIVDEDTGETITTKIVAYIKEKENNIRIPVNRYFNTFHYKLFCTMVAISIAIASRKKTKINLPLILDDIFYASDFENRAKIEKFIKKMFTLFDQYTPDMPLQMILFTHDNIIFDSAILALNHADNLKMNFAKLFRPTEATINSNSKNIISKIPANLPYKILSKNFA